MLDPRQGDPCMQGDRFVHHYESRLRWPFRTPRQLSRSLQTSRDDGSQLHRNYQDNTYVERLQTKLSSFSQDQHYLRANVQTIVEAIPLRLQYACDQVRTQCFG